MHESQNKTVGQESSSGGLHDAPVRRSRESMVAKAVKFIIPVAVSVGLCVVMFRDIDFSDMMRVIKTDCDFRWIGLMMVMSVLPMVFRALRWGIQLRALGINAPVHVLVFSIFGTYAVNLVFPRLGEVWRTGYVAVREEARFSTVFGSMIADRFADLLTVGLLTLATFFLARGPIVEFVRAYPDAYQTILSVLTFPWVWCALAVAAVLSWRLLVSSRSRLAGKVRDFIRGLWDGFAAIARMRGKFRWLGLTVCIWGCYFLQLEVAFHAFPLTEALFESHGLLVVLVCFVLTSISMGIPSNGGIGPYQTTMLFGLGLFMPAASASGALAGMTHTEFLTVGAAFGNVLIASQTLVMILLGLVTFSSIAIERHRSGKKREGERL